MVSFFKMSRFGILLHASRFGTIRRFWRLAIRAIRDSDNPVQRGPRGVALCLARDERDGADWGTAAGVAWTRPAKMLQWPGGKEGWGLGPGLPPRSSK